MTDNSEKLLAIIDGSEAQTRDGVVQLFGVVVAG